MCDSRGVGEGVCVCGRGCGGVCGGVGVFVGVCGCVRHREVYCERGNRKVGISFYQRKVLVS